MGVQGIERRFRFTFVFSKYVAEQCPIRYAYPHASHKLSTELFEIEALSLEASEPGNENYVIRMYLKGTYEIRSFLSDNGVDEKRIAFAIEELGRSRQVRVRNEPAKRRPKNHFA